MGDRLTERSRDRYRDDDNEDRESWRDHQRWGPWAGMAWSTINTLLGITIISMGTPSSMFKIVMGGTMMISSVMVAFEWLDYFSALQPHRQVPEEEDDDA